MKSCRWVPFFVVALLAASGLFAEKAQDGTPPQKQDSTGKQAGQLKLIKSPIVPYPEEAQRKNIEGKVVLSIVVDAQGKVSDAKALSGPPELVQAAIDSAKQWEFVPPAHAPVATTVEIGYGHPKECPGPVSDSGEVDTSGRLKNEKGTVIDVRDDLDWPNPPYPTEDRKAGVAGEMVLSIRVSAEGKVTNVEVVKSLSPHLDDLAADTVRTWTFTLKPGSPGGLPDDFQFHIRFRPTCRPKF
jgi:TonB family protein